MATERESAERGTIALVGSGEFLPPIEPLDRMLLGRLRGAPRVVVLPTASAPDGDGVPERWARMGEEHFRRLGVPVEAVMVVDRADAESPALAERIAAATFVYLSGGKPRYLIDVLRSTPCWEAIVQVFERGGVVAGCSAGAMVLAGQMFDRPRVWQTVPGLALAPGFLVIPHFDEFPGWATGIVSLAERGVTIAGIEGSTALVGAPGDWVVAGRGGVTLFHRGQKTRYTAGERVPIPSDAEPINSTDSTQVNPG